VNIISVSIDLSTNIGTYLLEAKVQMQTLPFLSKEVSLVINVSQCQILKITADSILPATINFFVGGPAKLFELPKFK
jgi:hypothetical protein